MEAKVKTGAALDAEIDALLSRKSSHADAVDAEWMDDFKSRMKKLAWREEKMKEENQATSVKIKGYHCETCKMTTEQPVSLCQNARHPVRTVNTLKRFFECGNCRLRESCVGSARLPPRACSCGAYSWTPTGKWGNLQGSQVGLVSLDGSRLVTRAAESSSRNELSKISSMGDAK